jgi:hypothetical protein
MRLRKQPMNWNKEEVNGCPKGESVYKNPTSNEPLTCNLSPEKSKFLV